MTRATRRSPPLALRPRTTSYSLRTCGSCGQTCTWITAELDDQSVAEFFDDQVDEGRQPSHFGRLFLHTHPGSSPQPSGTDEETFARVFGGADWAVMFILAREGQTYARLRYNVGPGIDVEIPVEVDYGRPFAASDWESWQEEYEANVQIPPPEPPKPVKAAERSGCRGPSGGRAL